MDRDAAALADGFAPADRRTWEALVAEALKGASPDKLTRRTRDNMTVRPIYTRQDGEALGRAAGLPGAAPFARGAAAAGASQGWDVRQRQAHPDPRRANRDALEDLERGAGSVVLRVDRAVGAGQEVPDGVAAYNLDDLERALAGVRIDWAPVALDAGGRFAEIAAAAFVLLERRGYDPAALRLALGADPIGAALAGAAVEPEAGLALAAALATHAARFWPRAVPLLADGRPWHAAGASEAQELAAALATAVAYLRALEDAGLPIAEAAPRIGFALAADADFFLSVAKLRALRRLWARVLEAAGEPGAARGMALHAETASRMYARRDPWVNVLRGTVACFAAAAGGADSVTVLPFDHALGLPSPLARRIARNTQLILMEESNLHRVIDPAGGAWHVEALTDGLARAAWELFRRIEAEGGMVAACRAGTPQGWVAATWAERERDIATRREPVTGVSEFPDLHERPVEPEAFDTSALVTRVKERLATAAAASNFGELLALAREGRVARVPAARSGVAPLPDHHLGEAFERLRERGDLALARDGRRPLALLANLGPLAQHTTRATFAKNLLEAGGIEPVWSEPLTGAEAVGEALRRSGARVVALCSSDEVYADLAAPAARALKGAGCAFVCMMGRPAEEGRRAELEAAGVDAFVRAGDDMVRFLAGLHDRVGTPAGAEEGRR